jgi:hypothetical protein
MSQSLITICNVSDHPEADPTFVDGKFSVLNRFNQRQEEL